MIHVKPKGMSDRAFMREVYAWTSEDMYDALRIQVERDRERNWRSIDEDPLRPLVHLGFPVHGWFKGF